MLLRQRRHAAERLVVEGSRRRQQVGRRRGQTSPYRPSALPFYAPLSPATSPPMSRMSRRNGRSARHTRLPRYMSTEFFCLLKCRVKAATVVAREDGQPFADGGPPKPLRAAPARQVTWQNRATAGGKVEKRARTVAAYERRVQRLCR